MPDPRQQLAVNDHVSDNRCIFLASVRTAPPLHHEHNMRRQQPVVAVTGIRVSVRRVCETTTSLAPVSPLPCSPPQHVAFFTTALYCHLPIATSSIGFADTDTCIGSLRLSVDSAADSEAYSKRLASRLASDSSAATNPQDRRQWLPSSSSSPPAHPHSPTRACRHPPRCSTWPRLSRPSPPLPPSWLTPTSR